MLPDKISTPFSEALEKFDPTSGQPTHSHLAELGKVLSQIILVILYKKKNGIHNPLGLIQDLTTYTADYTAVFPWPGKPAI